MSDVVLIALTAERLPAKPSARILPTRIRYRTSFAAACAVWQTVGMTTETNQTNQKRPRREDYKVQKLVDRIETQLALQAKAVREASQTSSKN